MNKDLIGAGIILLLISGSMEMVDFDVCYPQYVEMGLGSAHDNLRASVCMLNYTKKEIILNLLGGIFLLWGLLKPEIKGK